jgi:hypothetical protein
MDLSRLLALAAQWQPNQASQLAEFCAIGVAYASTRLRLQRARRCHLSQPVLKGFQDYLHKRLLFATRASWRVHEGAIESARICFPQYSPAAEPNPCALARSLFGLFFSFPALPRLWLVLIGDWQRNFAEFIRRWNADRRMLAQVFFKRRRVGPIIELRAGLSDPHCGGRTVVEVRLQNGSVFYKCRSGRTEKAWFELLRWMNSRGYKPRFRCLKVLPRGTYFWMEGARMSAPRDAAQEARYYHRFGATAYLALRLRATDLHRENMVAAGAHPILIDAETLLHDDPRLESHDDSHALLQTGLLPLPRGTPGAEFFSSPLSFDDLAVQCPQIEGGFETAERFVTFSQSRRDAFGQHLRRISKLRRRSVLRPTIAYWQICEASVQPRALQSLFARTRTIARLCRKIAPAGEQLRREITSINRLDIPYFCQPCHPSGSGDPKGNRCISTLHLVLRALLGEVQRRRAFHSIGAAGG